MQRILNYFSDTMVYIEHRSTRFSVSFSFRKEEKSFPRDTRSYIPSTRLRDITVRTRLSSLAFLLSFVDERRLSSRFSLSLSPKRINDESWKDYVITLEWRALFEHETLRIIGFLLLLYVHRFQTNSPWPISIRREKIFFRLFFASRGDLFPVE